MSRWVSTGDMSRCQPRSLPHSRFNCDYLKWEPESGDHYDNAIDFYLRVEDNKDINVLSTCCVSNRMVTRLERSASEMRDVAKREGGVSLGMYYRRVRLANELRNLAQDLFTTYALAAGVFYTRLVEQDFPFFDRLVFDENVTDPTGELITPYPIVKVGKGFYYSTRNDVLRPDSFRKELHRMSQIMRDIRRHIDSYSEHLEAAEPFHMATRLTQWIEQAETLLNQVVNHGARYAITLRNKITAARRIRSRASMAGFEWYYRTYSAAKDFEPEHKGYWEKRIQELSVHRSYRGMGGDPNQISGPHSITRLTDTLPFGVLNGGARAYCSEWDYVSYGGKVVRPEKIQATGEDWSMNWIDGPFASAVGAVAELESCAVIDVSSDGTIMLNPNSEFFDIGVLSPGALSLLKSIVDQAIRKRDGLEPDSVQVSRAIVV